MGKLFYFRHYRTELQNPNVAAFFKRYGAKGYGVYWYLMERLYDADGNMIRYDKAFIKELAKATKLSKLKINLLIADMDSLRLVGLRNDMLYSSRVENEIMAVLKSRNSRDIQEAS